MGELHYVGTTMPNDLAYGKVTGQVTYCSDMDAVGMLHLKCKPSEVTHGIIRSIDVSEAERMPGVHAVFTVFNTPDTLYDRGRVSAYEKGFTNQERLFDRHIRFYGERVAAVVADTQEIAEEACRRIYVEYDLLPSAVSMEEAKREGAPRIHEDGNVYAVSSKAGDYEDTEADYTFHSEISIGRMTHLSMETQVARARFDAGRGKLTVWSGTQSVYGVRSTVADLIGLPYSKVRVIKTVMGGSFGCKQEWIVEPLVAYAAWKLRADVKCCFSREEQIVNTMLKHNLQADIESKVNEDGVIQGLKVDVDMDAGAYTTVTRSYLRTMGSKLSKCYRYKNIEFVGRVVCTTTPTNGSFRSWGSSEAAICLEPHWNYVARNLGIDPIEFRLRNLLDPSDREALRGVSVGEVRLRETLIEGRKRFRWKERRKLCQRKNAEQDRYRYGVGMALCSHSSSLYPRIPENATCVMELQDDGSLLVRMPVHDHGCGTVLAMKKIVAEIFQLDLERIELQEADTETMPYDYGCYSSRTAYVFGMAAKRCAEEFLEELRDVAAMQLGCAINTVQYECGFFYPEAETEKRLTLRDVWEYSIFTRGNDLHHISSSHARQNPGTAAAHFTEVRVDTYTGRVQIEHCLSVHDVGKAINPDLCAGQIGSGIQQGIGMALCEEIKIDPETGKTLITNFKNYEVVNAYEMPDYDWLLIEAPDPQGPYGAKGIGEVVLAPVAPAIVSAVNEALDLNLELHDLPLTPPVILEALTKERDRKHSDFTA